MSKGGIRIPLVSDWNPAGINKAKRDFKKLETTSQKFAFGMKKAFLPATAGLVALGGAAKTFIDAGEQAATSNARIRNVTESMGLFGEASAEVTEKLIKQAEETARLTGVDQNQIKQAQASLMTFGELAQSADEMGGSFDRATQLTIDLAAAGFGSVETNAIQLGKALNDPIKGLSALSRSGVTFSETQKDMIAGLVESGKQFEAQDIILKAIEQQVGGTGEATANATDKLKVGFSQMSESIGQALLPLVETVIPVMIGLFEFMGDHTGVVIGLGIAMGGVAAAIVAVNVAMKAYAAATAIAKAATWLFNAALSANPIGLIVIAVAGLIATLVVLQKKFDIIGIAIDGMKKAFEASWDGIQWVINKIIDGVNEVISLLNKVPFVDIPEISHLGDSAEDAAGKVGGLVGEAILLDEEIKNVTEPMGRFETSIRNVADRADLAAEPMEHFWTWVKSVKEESYDLEGNLNKVHEAFDPLTGRIETATNRLDLFFQSLDRQDATDQFVEELGDIAEKLGNVQEGTKQWSELQREAYEQLRTLREARTDLDDSFFEALKLEIDVGNLPYVVQLLENMDYYLGLDYTAADLGSFGMGFNVPNFGSAPTTPLSQQPNTTEINVYPPAGTDENQLARDIYAAAEHGVFNSSLPISTTDAIRN